MDLCTISSSNDGQVACGALAFRLDGRPSIVAVVKATFRLAEGRAAEVIAPDALVVKDRHLGEDGAKSVLVASDLLPFKPRCDVTLVGHACAPRGQAVSARAVRLLVARLGAAAPGAAAGWRTLLDKTVVLLGEPSASGPVPFERARVCHEIARGGAGIDDNPVGREAPLLIDPLDEARPAGMGPVPPFWPVRRKRRGAFDAAILKEAAPDLPAGFPWDFFQSAPADQQIEPLAGDEVVQLDGLFADRFRVTTRLPSARAAAMLYRLGANGQVAELPLSLVADTLAIDTDRGTLSVTWRGRASLLHLDDLPVLHLAAGLSVAGSAIAWPAAALVAARIASGERAPLSAAPSRLAGHTVALPDDAAERGPEGVTPFSAPASVRAPASLGAPPAPAMVSVVAAAAPAPARVPVATAAVSSSPSEPASSPWGGVRTPARTIGERMAVLAPPPAAPPPPSEPVWIDVDEDTADGEEPPEALAKAPPAAVAKVLRRAGATDTEVAAILAAL